MRSLLYFISHGKSTPPAHRTGLFRPTSALPTPPVGVPASPWMWAKARSKLGAMIRLCGDGAVSNEAKMGSSLFFILHTRKKHPSCTQNRAVPTHHRTPAPVGVLASPWMWAKARSKLGALIRLCGDGAVSKEAKMNEVIIIFYFTRKKHPSCTQNRAVPTHLRTPDAPRRRSRLALDVGEGQKQTRCIDPPVRRRGGVK
jgi:hypothetical protein